MNNIQQENNVFTQHDLQDSIAEHHGYFIKRHIHTIFQDKRVRALYGGVLFRPIEETFHEFLIFNLKRVLGDDWKEKQIQLSSEKKHFIFMCYEKYLEWLQKNKNDEEKIRTGRYSGQPDGYTQWLICLAYDIYCLMHTNHLPERLLKRLKTNSHEFQGARYEIAIAATFVRAGFEIDYIDESAQEALSKRNVEFIANFKETATKIAVEAKSKVREGAYISTQEFTSSAEPKIKHLLLDALKKDNEGYPFMIFIDLNLPYNSQAHIPDKKSFQELFDKVSKYGTQQPPHKENGVFLTNFSHHYFKDKQALNETYVFSRSLKPQKPIPDLAWNRILICLNKYGEVPDLDEIYQNNF